ncbi:putative uroporphyrinogen-III synthase [Moraxella macacae 0408225]|uniref:Uroporphyrinogen-III synthase n=1 Tax=Moraxella macacae 0408225 TaxID=1230338 RepID=L2F959_9GAMM|nr:uroporphyrinogen-III synthase [Moraxella macacae]ELA09579.1 putative uroporphyrinogen-III synthase [Moraxella macacae 0408225]
MIFINTRPLDRGNNLSRFLTSDLQSCHIQVLDLPLLELVACKIRAIDKQKLANLDHYQYIVFVSERAVSEFFNHVANFNHVAKHKVAKHNIARYKAILNANCIAVGQKTATAFCERFQQNFNHLPTILTPSQCNLPENNEGLLQLDAIKNLQANTKILIIKGNNGRTLLKNTLQQRGVIVDTVDVYERIFPIASQQIFANFYQSADFCQNKVVLITSITAWQYWQNLLTKFDLANAAAKQGFVYLVLQARIAKVLKEQGVYNVHVVNDVNPTTIQQKLLSQQNY